MTTGDLVECIDRTARSLPIDQVHLLANTLDDMPTADPGARFRLTSLAATPAFRDAATQLAESWLLEADLPGRAISVALRACASAVAAERAQEAIDVVWTGPHTNEVPVRLTSATLVDVIESAKTSLILVSFAAYKVDLINDALKAAAARGVRVRIILETDQAGGGTLTFGARAAFDALKDAVGFYIWPAAKRPLLEKGRASLHAKAAIADDHTALVTSANLTGHAIKENMELGLLVRGGPVPRRLSRHFQHLIEDGVLEPQL